MNSVEKGRKGEDKAASFLEGEGYRIVRRNFRAYGSEIDIVAVKDSTTVFAEVKYWNALGFDQMERALDGKKRAGIVRASKAFLLRYPVFSSNSIRYDLIYLCDSGENPKHVMNAFTETN